MAKAINLTGQKFGYLEVIERDYDIQKEHPNERQAWWKCECKKCGKIKSFRGSVLRKGAKSCGCDSNLKGTHISEEHKKRISEGIKNSDKFKQAMKKVGENKRLNLINQKFGRLTVIEYADEEHQIFYNEHHKTTWKCRCNCGNICYVTTECLRRGDTLSCGCITKENAKAKLKDLTGQKFGHLLVLKWLGTINHNSKYLVRCDCGKEYEIYSSSLTQGTTTSCGCVKESHGETKIRKILLLNNIQFENQKKFLDLKGDKNYPLKYDFYLPKYNILIEYDGEQHFKPIFNWDTEKSFNQRKKYDKLKNNYAIQNNYILIRIPYTHYGDLCLEDLLENSKFIIKEEY